MPPSVGHLWDASSTWLVYTQSTGGCWDENRRVWRPSSRAAGCYAELCEIEMLIRYSSCFLSLRYLLEILMYLEWKKLWSQLLGFCVGLLVTTWRLWLSWQGSPALRLWVDVSTKQAWAVFFAQAKRESWLVIAISLYEVYLFCTIWRYCWSVRERESEREFRRELIHVFIFFTRKNHRWKLLLFCCSSRSRRSYGTFLWFVFFFCVTTTWKTTPDILPSSSSVVVVASSSCPWVRLTILDSEASTSRLA